MAKMKILRLKITLKDVSNPTVWRIITIPSTMTFDELHIAIQAVMGWDDVHLYEFVDNAGYGKATKRIAIPSDMDTEMDGLKTTHVERYKIYREFAKKGDKLYYIYDFGDHWVHEVELLSTFTTEEEGWIYCEDGEGSCPPEDIGGAHAYEEIKKKFRENELGEVVLQHIFTGDEEYINVNYFRKHEAQRCLDIWQRHTYQATIRKWALR